MSSCSLSFSSDVLWSHTKDISVLPKSMTLCSLVLNYLPLKKHLCREWNQFLKVLQCDCLTNLEWNKSNGTSSSFRQCSLDKEVTSNWTCWYRSHLVEYLTAHCWSVFASIEFLIGLCASALSTLMRVFLLCVFVVSHRELKVSLLVTLIILCWVAHTKRVMKQMQ